MIEATDAEERPTPPRAGSKRANGIEAHRRWLAERQRIFANLFDFTHGQGLEIGPLDTPAVDALTSDVSYVDVYDRAGTADKYRDDDNVLLEMIPDTTYPLWDGQRMRSLADAAASGGPFDWVVASHVVEHVPNLITWLTDIQRITTADGALVLAAPDRRFTFDCQRPPTTTGQVLDAYLRGDERPSPRAVYDSQSSYVPVDGATGLTRGVRPPGRSARPVSPLSAFEAAKQALDDYVDTHVWTFSVQEFVDLIKELRELGLCDWYVERLAGDPAKPDFEFLLVLRKVPAGGGFVEAGFDSDLPGWLADQWQLRDTAQHLANQLSQAVEMLNQLSAKLGSN